MNLVKIIVEKDNIVKTTAMAVAMAMTMAMVMAMAKAAKLLGDLVKNNTVMAARRTNETNAASAKVMKIR